MIVRFAKDFDIYIEASFNPGKRDVRVPRWIHFVKIKLTHKSSLLVSVNNEMGKIYVFGQPTEVHKVGRPCMSGHKVSRHHRDGCHRTQWTISMGSIFNSCTGERRFEKVRVRTSQQVSLTVQFP